MLILSYNMAASPNFHSYAPNVHVLVIVTLPQVEHSQVQLFFPSKPFA